MLDSDIYTFLVFILGWAVIWFVASMCLKRNDIADIAWGLFPACLGVFLTIQNPVSGEFYILLILIAIWGLRLAWHISGRTFGKISEDPRYKKWRNTWKYFYIRSFFQVFLLQSFLAFLLSFVLIFSLQKPDISLVNILGIGVFIFGFLYELLADLQLRDFLQKKRLGLTDSKICQTGLWKYSRHPNYFGEVVLWWGIFLVSFETTVLYYLIISPILITFLILKVSGIPMSESRKSGKEWEDYKSTTPAFFPKFF